MSLLEIQNLAHGYGDKTLYKNVSVDFYNGEHVGIVGPNGTGKSTFVKILTGEVVPDSGSIKWKNGVKIGHLGQYAEVDGDLTVTAYLKTAFTGLYETESGLNALYQEMERGCADKKLLLKAARYQEQLENSGFYSIDSSIGMVAVGLGLDAIGMDRQLSTLSGGQRAKVILAKLLLENADVLILDEPTNFLDKEHVEWLASFLRDFDGSFFVVSHDFEFLEKTGNTICDIEFGTIRKYASRYSLFVKQKEQRRENYLRQYRLQEKEIERTEEFIRRNIAGIKTKMARGRRKQLARMERLEKPDSAARIRFSFAQKDTAAQPSLTVSGLLIGYDYPLLDRIDLRVKGGRKVVITGFNGIGKSTLLKTLAGLIPALSGSYQFSENAAIGYYEQDLFWKNPDMTPLEVISDEFPALTHKIIRKYLADCGIRAEHIDQKAGSLSGGEQSKLKLCRLMLRPTNFLILDEPTNHLDSDTKDSLKTALTGYRGTVILVSHEAKFYEDWAEEQFDVEKLLCRS